MKYNEAILLINASLKYNLQLDENDPDIKKLINYVYNKGYNEGFQDCSEEGS